MDTAPSGDSLDGGNLSNTLPPVTALTSTRRLLNLPWLTSTPSSRGEDNVDLLCSSTSCCQRLPRRRGWQRLTFLRIHGYDLFDKITEFSKDVLFISAMTPAIKEIRAASNKALIGV